jgi:acyl-CoA thioester hydrolase
MQIVLPISVLAFETDFGGVVSNTRYPEYLERGRHEMMRVAGLKTGEVWEQHNAMPILRRVEIDYLGFARHEDDLILRARVASHTRATTLIEFELTRPLDGVVIMRARQTLAYLNKSWRPTRVPEIYRQMLAPEFSDDPNSA